MNHSGRRLSAAVLTVVTSIAMLVTLLAHQANHVFVNSDSFSARAVTVVRSQSVESLIADSVTSRLSEDLGGRSDVQALIGDAVREALSNPEISDDIRTTAKLLQSQLVSGDATVLTLTLPELGSEIASSLESKSPQLADQVARIGTITVVDVRIPSSAARAAHDLATLGRDSSLLLVLTAALALLALIISPDRRRTVRALGLGAVVSGLAAAALYLVGRGLVIDEFSTEAARTAARAAWSVYLAGVMTAGLVLAGIGAVIALAATLARPRAKY